MNLFMRLIRLTALSFQIVLNNCNYTRCVLGYTSLPNLYAICCYQTEPMHFVVHFVYSSFVIHCRFNILLLTET